MISISDDIDLARREVKLQIAFYSTTRTYTPILELHGKADDRPGSPRGASATRTRKR